MYNIIIHYGRAGVTLAPGRAIIDSRSDFRRKTRRRESAARNRRRRRRHRGPRDPCEWGAAATAGDSLS